MTVQCAVYQNSIICLWMVCMSVWLWVGWYLWSAWLWQVVRHSLTARNGWHLWGSRVHRPYWYLSYSTDTAALKTRYITAGLFACIRHRQVTFFCDGFFLTMCRLSMKALKGIFIVSTKSCAASHLFPRKNWIVNWLVTSESSAGLIDKDYIGWVLEYPLIAYYLIVCESIALWCALVKNVMSLDKRVGWTNGKCIGAY